MQIAANGAKENKWHGRNSTSMITKGTAKYAENSSLQTAQNRLKKRHGRYLRREIRKGTAEYGKGKLL
jgi:hypothetical protein